jgi:hypothetical protein
MKPLLALAGTVAEICVAELMVKPALTPLNATADAVEKLVPLMTMLVFAAPFVGEKLKMAGGGFVWPSTFARKAAATEDGSAVKKAKPVSTSIWLADVTKFCQWLVTENALGIFNAITRVLAVMRLDAVPLFVGTNTAIFQV